MEGAPKSAVPWKYCRATQFFRRKCFESIGGLVAIPEGGWDAITCVQPELVGTYGTFPDLIVDHLKPRNISEGNVFRRNWQMGSDYALGSHPLFEVVKCMARTMESLCWQARQSVYWRLLVYCSA